MTFPPSGPPLRPPTGPPPAPPVAPTGRPDAPTGRPTGPPLRPPTGPPTGPPPGPSEAPGRRWARFASLAAVPGGVAVAFNATSEFNWVQPGGGLALPWLGSGGRSSFDLVIYAGAAGLVLALTAGLMLWRRWPWLIGAAALLALPVAALSEVSWAPSSPLLLRLIIAAHAAAAPLAVVGVLGAAQELYRRGAVGLAAPVAGSVIGAELVGRAVIGAGWLHYPSGFPTIRLGLTVFALVTAVVGGVGQLLGQAPRDSSRISPRAVAAGGLAALLVLMPVAVPATVVGDLLQVSVGSLARRPYVLVGITGLGILAVALVLALIAGTSVLAGVAAVGLVLVGTSDPTLLAFAGAASHSAFSWGAALVGVLVGLGLAWPVWRAAAAAVLAVASAVVLLVLDAAIGGEPEKLIAHDAHVPAGLMIALFVATAVVTVSALVPVTARRGALPAVGPLVAATVLGGVQALSIVQVQHGEPVSSYLNGARHLGISAVLLLVAGVVIAAIGAGEWLLHRQRVAAT